MNYPDLNNLSKDDGFLWLIGKTIIGYTLSENKQQIIFHTNNAENIPFIANSECCSQSWFEDINSMTEFPCEITGVIEKEINGEESTIEQAYTGGNDCIKKYFYTLTTTKGDLDIEMRNASNGYYGGSVYYDGWVVVK